jgi:galactokinase
MNGKELLQKLESPASRPLFEKLYGNDAAAGMRRYAVLVEGMIDEAAFPRSGFPEAGSELRLFTAAGRTELGGNHTDHNRGRVLAASIQMDQAAVAASRSDGRIFFRSTGYPDAVIDIVDTEGRPDLAPREKEKGTTEALIRGIAAEFVARGAAVSGLSVNADSTVLAGSGLSSSAAVEVLFGRIINNFYYEGKCNALEIAQIGQIVENVYFGKPCGLMDQTACAFGGAVAIDFADPQRPRILQVDVDLAAAGYALCVVNTRGSHADLTPDYAAIPTEMKAVAAFFGKEVLRECDEEKVKTQAAELRNKLGDRALLRALHFFGENRRAADMHAALEKLNSAQSLESKQKAMMQYLALVNESGDSSWELLQNVYSTQNVKEQGIASALALTRDFLRSAAVPGACRVHGGGFAGTIQAYIPVSTLEDYRSIMDGVFGAGSVTVLRIRPAGAEELIL